jgi:hypothetical protein
MNKRLFLKLLSLAGFGAVLPIPKALVSTAPPVRKHLTTCGWDELIGLRFKWPVGVFCPHDAWKGIEWVVCGKEVESWFKWHGQDVSNFYQNKYYARPVGKREPLKLLCFDPVIMRDSDGQGFMRDYSRVELPPNMFYRA